MIKKLTFVLLFLGVTATAAYADLPGASYLQITTTALIQVKSGAGVLYGAVADGTETNPLTCYDNNAGTATNPITPSATLGSAGAAMSVPANGIAFNSGLVCQVPTAIVTGIHVYFK